MNISLAEKFIALKQPFILLRLAYTRTLIFNFTDHEYSPSRFQDSQCGICW